MKWKCPECYAELEEDYNWILVVCSRCQRSMVKINEVENGRGESNRRR